MAQNGKSEKRHRSRTDLFTFLAVGLAVLVLFYAGSRSLYYLRWSAWAYGDAQTLIAAQHFRNEGFLAGHFLPQVDPGLPHDLTANNLPNGRYSHYPPLQPIVAGLLADLFGNPLYPARLLSVFLSTAALLLWALAVREYFGGRVALLAMVLIAASTRWLDFADSVSGQALDEFFRAAVVFWVIRAARHREDTRVTARTIGVLWALLFLQAFNSIDYLLYLPLFIGGFGVMFRRSFRLSFWQYACLGTAPVLALLLHFGQTAVEWGSVQGAAQDWLKISKAKLCVGPQLFSWADEIEAVSESLGESLVRPYKLGFVLIGVWLAWAFWQRSFIQGKNDRFKLLLLLLVCGLAFYLAAPRQTVFMEMYSANQIWPAVAIALAAAMVAVTDAALKGLERLSPGFTRWERGGWVIIVAGLSGLIIPVRPLIDYMAAYPNLLGTGKLWGLRQHDPTYWQDRRVEGAAIRAATQSNDITLVPQESAGNAPMEAGGLEEFFAERHLVPMGESLEIIRERSVTLQSYWVRFRNRAPGLEHAGIFMLVDSRTPPELKDLAGHLSKTAEGGGWKLYRVDWQEIGR